MWCGTLSSVSVQVLLIGYDGLCVREKEKICVLTMREVLKFINLTASDSTHNWSTIFYYLQKFAGCLNTHPCTADRVHAADTGSALQRPELDVCVSAGTATGHSLCSQLWARPPDCDLAVCRGSLQTLSCSRTLQDWHCQSVTLPLIPSSWLCLQVTLYTLTPMLTGGGSSKYGLCPHYWLQQEAAGTPESDDNCLAARGCISEVSLHRNVSAAVCTVCSIIIALSRKCPLCHCHSDYNVLYAGECVVSAVRHPDIFPAQTVTKVRRNILTLRKHQKKSQPWIAVWWSLFKNLNLVSTCLIILYF